MMARATRIGLWLAAIAVILVLSLWMLLPVFVSSEFVRAAIERELADITGQEIRVEGRVNVELFPTPVARLYDVHVPSDTAPPDDAPADFLVVDSVEVSIAIASLLARDPEFSQFRLVRPTMRVLVDDRGRIDFAAIDGRLGREIERVRAELEQAEGADGDAPEPARSPEYARFGTVAIESGIIEFVGPYAQEPERITAVNGIVSWPRFDGRLSASLDGIWRGAAFTFRTEIDEALRLLAGSIVDVRQDFTSDVLTYSFDGKLGVGTEPFVEGAVALETPSPRQALDWIGAGIKTGGAVGNVALSGIMRGDANKVRLENLEIDMQGSDGTGVLEIAVGEAGRPSVTATLDFAEMDLLGFLSAFTGLPKTRDALVDPVARDILRQLEVDLRLSAASATAGALRFGNVATVTQIRKGGAMFEMPDATAYGGRVQAELKLVPEGDMLAGTLGLSLTDVDSAAAADALQIAGLFPRGLASGTLQARASMDRWGDFFRRADGKLDLTVTNGQLDGIAFRTFGGGAESPTFFRLRDNAVASEVFETLDFNALIKDGVIIVDKGTIEYPSGTVQLNGVIPYGTASLALTTIAEGDEETEAGVPAMQHFIGGSWSNPYAMPVLQPPAPPAPPSDG